MIINLRKNCSLVMKDNNVDRVKINYDSKTNDIFGFGLLGLTKDEELEGYSFIGKLIVLKL